MLKNKLQSGFSMIEILIVATILGLLIILAISMLPKQISKGRDGRRKSDLQKIKIAFENYYSDNDCYPEPEILDNCEGPELSPYLASIPCDPQTKTKYLYAPESDSCANYYRVFADLEVEVDPVIAEIGCDSGDGCGAYSFFSAELDEEDASNYNYGVSEGVPIYVSDVDAPPGTKGFCCNTPGDQCNDWTLGKGNCVDFFSDIDQCINNSGCVPQE
jgi:prepilin-type N-terminal cleavage/methylation domain-containing protein